MVHGVAERQDVLTVPPVGPNAELLAALGSEHRLQIVELLRMGERCVCEITPAFSLDPSVVSRHLAILEHAGIIAARREGRRIYYQLTDHRLLRVLDTVQQMIEHPGQARAVAAKSSQRRHAC